MSTSTATLNWGIVCTDSVRRSATARRCRDNSISSSGSRGGLDQREHVLLLDPPARAAAVDGRQVDAVLLREPAGDRHRLPLRRGRGSDGSAAGTSSPGAPMKPSTSPTATVSSAPCSTARSGSRHRGLDLERRLVGLDLEQRVALLDGRAHALEPPDDPQLVRGRPERRHAHRPGHQSRSSPDHGLDPLHGGDDRVLERRRRGHRGVERRDPPDRRLEVVEALLGHPCRDLRAPAAGQRVLVDDHEPPRLAHRGEDGLGVEREQGQRVDHLALDPVSAASSSAAASVR